MRVSRWMTGTGLGALCAAAALLAPALQARENGRILRPLVRPVVSVAEGVAAFTPAAADPKLAAMLCSPLVATSVTPNGHSATVPNLRVHRQPP